jgi:hypothetical protein
VAFTSQPKKKKKTQKRTTRTQAASRVNRTMQKKKHRKCRRNQYQQSPSKLKIQESNCSPVPCQKKKKKNEHAHKKQGKKGKKYLSFAHSSRIFFFNPSPQVKKNHQIVSSLSPHTRAARKKSNFVESRQM